jgi:TonB family protein
MVKVAVYMIAFYLVYSILLSRDTSYARNRIYIILSLISAFILPFITLQTNMQWNIQVFGKLLSEVLVTASAASGKALIHGTFSSGLLQLVYSIYIIVAFVFILKLLIDFSNLLFLILRHRKEGSRIIRFHGFSTSGFSAMGYIFINTRLSPEDAGEIIRHEQNHLKQNHFIDIIFIETVKAFQWFNPCIYLFNRSLRAIHEYQADQQCLSSGVPIVNYQCLLLNQIFKSRAFSLTNSFSNPSLIKKRMIMMTKKRTSAIASFKIISVVPVIGVVFLALTAFRDIPGSYIKQFLPVISTQNSYSGSASKLMPPPLPPPASSSESTEHKQVVKEKLNDEPSYEPFVVVEEMPMFPGGDEALLKYIGSNTSYPENAKKRNIQGKVIVRFCIKPDGGVTYASVLKGVSTELDAEALRVVNSLPSFKPGMQSGKAVPVWYMVPISFTLK